MYFNFMSCVIKPITGPYTAAYAVKTAVMPLTVMAKNETCYADVVDILTEYEAIFHRVVAKSKVENVQDHMAIGGDLLTVSRFRYYCFVLCLGFP